MGRHQKERVVCALPRYTRFGACGACREPGAPVFPMSVDEFETIRLIDYEGLKQEEAAVRMEIARTTVQSIYAEARKKIATAFVLGGSLAVDGGNIRICGGRPLCGDRGCPRRQHCLECGIEGSSIIDMHVEESKEEQP
jgi:predicted DNA-binding protein (UPF0251 family)